MSEVFVTSREWVSELCVIITKAADKADKFSYYSVISGINDWPGDPPQHKEMLLKRIEDMANGDEPNIIIDILIAAGSGDLITPGRAIEFRGHGHNGWREVLDNCIQRKFNRLEYNASCEKKPVPKDGGVQIRLDKLIPPIIFFLYAFAGLKCIEVIISFFK